MTTGITAKGVVATPGIPDGGTTGQALKKSSDTDYAVEWGAVASSASDVTFTPAGNIAATDVQAALEELDTEKSSTSHNHTGVYQPLDAGLTDIAALAVTDGNIIVGDGANWVAESGATARTSLGAAAASHTHSLADITDEGALASLNTVGTSQIDDDAVTYAKIQNVSATDMVLGRSSSGSGDVEEIACTAAGRALIDDASASAQRTTLGLGTAATQNTGTSGANVPLLDGANTWSAGQTIATTATNGLVIQRTEEGNGGSGIALNHNTTTPAANDRIGTISFNEQNSAAAGIAYCQLYANVDDPTSGSEDGSYRFDTYQAGAIATRCVYGGGVYHPSATGTDKGNNTINFGAVYDDNTLLTCYVFDAALDGGTIDIKRWDDNVPNTEEPEFRTREPVTTRERIVVERIEVVDGKKRLTRSTEEREVPVYETIPVVLEDGSPVVDEKGQPVTRRIQVEREIVRPAKTTERTHEPLRKFAARIGGPEDPLDLEKYINHWKTKRHLTSLPNEAKFDPVKGLPTGAWIQRLVETVEIQAVHISQLNDRIKALEAAQK